MSSAQPAVLQGLAYNARLQPGSCLARLCTRSTIGLHEEEFREASNGTGLQRRRLLSKNSVTAAFSAQVLWAAGYQGKGVKMGVFDTGIRDDHPHVKNIKCASSWLINS